MKYKINIPTEELISLLKRGEIKTLSAAKMALGKVGSEIAKDAATHPPTPRIDTGNLRGSWAVTVGKNTVITGDKYQGGQETGQDLELRVGFNMPYAASMEFGTRNGKPIGFGIKSRNATPKAGNFFLRTKINNKALAYLDHLAKFLGGELK